MSKLFALALIFGAVCLFAAPAPTEAVAAQSSATVQVECDKGESINKALSKHAVAQSLVVEVSGMCRENVVVTRDRVTLRGTDPASDGVDAVANTNFIDAALWVKGAHAVSIENLKLTGGFSGLLATNVSTPLLRLVNCRMEGNRSGIAVQASVVQANNSVFGPNDNINVEVFLGSNFACFDCTLADPQGSLPGPNRTNAVAADSRLVLNQCTLTNGGIQATGSRVNLADSAVGTITPNSQAVSATASSNVSLTRVQVAGTLFFSQGATAQLLGVTQTPNTFNNTVNEGSHVRVGDASPATGGPPSIPSDLRGFGLNNFANLSLFQTSQVNGSLNCLAGANAFCVMPTNVSGTSNCGLCPKP